MKELRRRSSRTAKNRLGAGDKFRKTVVGPGLLLILVASGGLSGCAIHYADVRTGSEHIWGLGQLRLATNRVGDQLVSVTTGSRVPGICLELGRDHFGLAFGYLGRQRLAVVDSNQAANVQPPSGSPAVRLGGESGTFWGFGHVRMKSVPSANRHYAIVTGKALAGLGARAGGGDTSIGFALATRQEGVVQNENMFVELDQTNAPHWPGFDLFTTHVHVSVPNPTNEIHE